MTGELYIYEIRGHYQLSKTINGKSKTFGYYETMDEAIFAKELLMKYDWDLDEVAKLGNVLEFGDEFLVVTIYDNKLKFLDKFKTRSGAEGNADKIIKEFMGNPYRGKYGIYIYKRDSYFDIKKLVNGKDVLFGIYKNLDDATFARDLLMQYNWSFEDISDEGNVFYSQIHEKYIVTAIIKDKLVVVSRYDSEVDALNNAEKDIEEHQKSRYKTGEKYIVFNGRLFAVHYYTKDKKVIYFGSFPEKIDAMSVRDVLIECEWDLSQVDENKIYEVNDYFWKFHIFEGMVKIIGKYQSRLFAEKDINNLSNVTYEDLYDPNNPYSKINRYIRKRLRKFWIRKEINGEIRFLGPYYSREEAIEARDEFESNDWNVDLDNDSIFSLDEWEDGFSEIVNNLTLWQKIIYDTIDRIGKEIFTYSELINHSFLKRYKSGKNFEGKVDQHLNELVDLGLVTYLGEDFYRREF